MCWSVKENCFSNMVMKCGQGIERMLGQQNDRKVQWKMKLVSRMGQFIGYICITLLCNPFHGWWCYISENWLCVYCWQNSVVPFEALFTSLAILLYSVINNSWTAFIQASILFWMLLADSASADRLSYSPLPLI